MDKKLFLTTMAAAMTLTSCQGQQTNTSFEDPLESSPSYSEPKIQSGTMAEPQKSTTSYTLTFEAMTKTVEETEKSETAVVTETVETSEKVETEKNTRSYTASPNVIIKNNKVIGTHPIKSENVTTTVTVKNPVQISTEPTSNSTLTKTPTKSDVGKFSEESKDIQQLNQNIESKEFQQSNNVQELINSPQPSGKPQLAIPENQIQAIYTVADNDCLTQIADKYQNISAEDIARANNMDSINGLILPGQHLIIPKPNVILPDIPSTEDSSNNKYYEVKTGESFWSIGSKFGISDRDLAKYNGMSTNDTIHPGDILKVPSVDECNIEPEVSNTPEVPKISEVSNVSDENSIEEEVSNIQEISSEENYPLVDVTDENVSEESTSTENSLEADSLFVEPSTETTSNETYPIENVYTNYDVETADGILNTIKSFESEYLGTNIAMGIYSLDGTPLFEYNTYSPISGACTVKAPYAMYVLKCCEDKGINIWSEKLQYQDGMRNDGSGEIKNDAIGSEYSIAYLLSQLLSISDNTAYNILLSSFSLDGYQEFLNSFGGQQLCGLQYGTVSVEQRKNEWLAIYQYLNSGNYYYSTTLQQMLSNTDYCYLVQGMSNWHNYMHKSGWCDGISYNSASDCAIIDNRYLVIVLSQDYLTGTAHTDIVNVLGREAELFMN